MKMDGLILAGGKSNRMGGYHKGNLLLGKETFTEHLVKELKKEAEQVWISYGETIHECCEGCLIVKDVYSGCGPIGGLHAGIMTCHNEAVMAAACDMPFLRTELFRYLAEQLEQAEQKEWEEKAEHIGQTEQKKIRPYDGVVPILDGKIHPLAAIYRKIALPVLENQIAKGDYRVITMLQNMKILYVDVGEIAEFRTMLRNVNTLPEYQKIAEE